MRRRDALATEQAILGLGDEIHQLTKAQIGERVGRSQESVRLALRRLGIKHDGHAAAVSQHETRHGTPGAWTAGCRCDICVEAKRAYKSAEHQRRKDRFDPARYEHGTVTAYQAGCPCDPCAEAMRASLLERNAKTRTAATGHGPRWTGEDVGHAIRQDLSIEQAAADLGRTYAAISNVRKAVANPADPAHARYVELLGWDVHGPGRRHQR